MPLQKEALNNDFPAGVRCAKPWCFNRDTVAHPSSDEDADFGCTECGHTWNEDSEHGSTVVIGVAGAQPDFERDGVVSVHIDYDVVADWELVEKTNNVAHGDEVDIVHIVYYNGCDGRIVTQNARIKSVGPM